MSEVWEKWQDQVINGVFPLRRLLGYSDHSAVFLTEFKARSPPDAALKLVPADAVSADAQLAIWNETAALSHPHLIQLLEAGRCELDGLPFVFFVMEYAEQTLAQILPQRALTPDEVREMLRPTLAALGFLHRRHWVQGALKPSNILVVGDQLKLASDTLRPSGESAADDVWALGVTMVEALTQHPPAGANEDLDHGVLAASLPESLAGMVRQCLSRNPADRPTVADLETQLGPALPTSPAREPAPHEPVPQAPAQQAPVARAPPPAPVTQALTPPAALSWPRRRVFIAALVVVSTVALMIWAGMRNSHPPLPPAPVVATVSDSKPAAPADTSPHSDQPEPAAAISQPILHEEIPDVPRSVRGTIRGRIKVAVRVAIDGAGNVTHAALEKPGTSKYFDQVATQAAAKWKFAPAERQDPRQSVVRFEFTRSGTVAHASPSQSSL
jgi:TonB family protein